MIKPWLLMNKQEQRERIDDYVSLVSSSFHGQPIDEGLLVSIKPPDSYLGALFELWLYQHYAKGKLTKRLEE